MKRIIQLVSLVVLSAILFAGCRQADAPQVAADPVATVAPAATPAPEAPPADVAPEPLSVMVHDRAGLTPAEDNFYTDWIREEVLRELNLDVTFVPVPRWSADEAISNMFAAGNMTDLGFSSDRGMIATFGRQGGIVNIAPYLNDHLHEWPNLEAWTDYLLWRNEDPQTGEIFSIHQRRVSQARHNTYIRYDWLNHLGLPLPTTTDEWLDALRAFRDNADDLPNRPEGAQIIPFTMSQNIQWRAGNLLNSFIDPNLTEQQLFMYNVADRPVLIPGIKEGARVLNMMFNEGLLDPDFILYSDNEIPDNLARIGVLGSWMYNWPGAWNMQPDLQEIHPDAQFRAIDPFRNPETGLTQKFIYDSAGTGMFVAATAPSALNVFRYLEWMATLDNRLFIQLGPEGITHEWIDGLPVTIDLEGEFHMNSGQNLDLTPIINGLDLGSPDLNSREMAARFQGVDSDIVVESINMALANGRPFPVVIVPGGLDFESANTAVFREMNSEILAVSITAPVDQFDETWDRLVQNYLNAGGQRAMDERYEGYLRAQGR